MRWFSHEHVPENGTGPATFECYWVPLGRAHVLSAGQGALLGRL